MYPSTTIAQIKKRTGQIVPFHPDKILVAVSKAFAHIKGAADPTLMRELTALALENLEQKFSDATPGVEDVQNEVEGVLMARGYFDVAKGYIIYRYEHAKVREIKKQELEKKIDVGGIFVVKRSGKKEPFSMEKIKQSLAHYASGYETIIHIDAVAEQVRTELYEDIETKEIARAIIMVLRSFIEHDPAYSFAAARALLIENYKTVIGHDKIDFKKLDQQLRDAFVMSIQKGVSMGKLDPRLLLFDIPAIGKMLQFSRDAILPYVSVQTLADRYFLRENYESDALETPQMFWMRVAMGLACQEEKKEEWAQKFYEVMSTLRYVPSTPTLFHAGTVHPQMSSCYLTTIEDDLTHIFKCIGDNAQLAKWSGGIGNDWSNLRGTNALIKATGVGSQGIIPFLKIANDTTADINRSGRRRGATCAYLETWHWDIEDFLELRKNTGDERRRTHDMNTANWIPDLFMKRVKNGQDWSLFSADETPELHHLYGEAFERKYEEYERKGEAGQLRMYRTMPARDLWKKMLTMLFETGHPWIAWKDPSNIRSPQDHVGVVHSSNLCTEITLNTSSDETAVCNLGSVNLERHITNEGALNMDMLQETVGIAMRMLDNVIDLNFYPTKEARNSNFRHRPVGLGIMGFQNALYKMDIRFDSDAGVAFADYSMEAVSYFAILGSTELARERGAYSSYRGSKWDRGLLPMDTIALLERERGTTMPISKESRMDWSVVREAIARHGMRNSNCLALAPTATISNIAGTTPTIEPLYKNIYVKTNQAGDFTIVNPYLVEALKKEHLWDDEMLGKLKYHDGRVTDIPEIPVALKEIYKEVFEVDPKWLILATAHRGKWVDQSQSMNLYYAGKSGKEISDMYLFAWEMGLKTTYYLRTLAMSQVEKSTVKTQEYGETHTRRTFLEKSASPDGAAEALSIERVTTTTVATHEPAMTAAQEASVPSLQKTLVSVVPPASLSEETSPKLCTINDPDCEACQ